MKNFIIELHEGKFVIAAIFMNVSIHTDIHAFGYCCQAALIF